MITSGTGGCLADRAWEVKVAVGATPTGKGVIPDEDPLAVRVIGCYPAHHCLEQRRNLNVALPIAG